MPHGGYSRSSVARTNRFLVRHQSSAAQNLGLSTYSFPSAGPVQAAFTRHYVEHDGYIDAIGIPFTSKITGGTLSLNIGLWVSNGAPYYEPTQLANASAWNTVALTSANFDGGGSSIQTYFLSLQSPAYVSGGSHVFVSLVSNQTGTLAGGAVRTSLLVWPAADPPDDSYNGVSRSDFASANGSYAACNMTYFATTPGNLMAGTGTFTGSRPTITLLTSDSLAGVYGGGYVMAMNSGNTIAEIDYTLRLQAV